MIRRNTWIVLGIFIVLLGVTTYLQITGKLKASSGQSTPSPTEPSVFKIDTGKVTGFTIQRPGEASLKAQIGNDGKWSVVEPKGSAVTADQIASAVGALQGWTIMSELNPVPPLGSMGLSTPGDTIILTGQNGQERRITIGNQTPSGSGYYVQVDGGTPLIVSMSNVNDVLQALPAKATPTAVTPGQGETAPPLTPAPGGTAAPVSSPAPGSTP